MPMLTPPVRDWLDAAYAQSLAAIPDGPAKDGGIAVGTAAAAEMLAARAGDGRFDPFTVVDGTDAGEWRPTPPNFGGDPAPWIGDVRPFLVPNVEMLRTDGPNALTSAAYAEDFNEVKKLGSLTSTSRTADQTAAAVFWQDSGTAIWNRAFRALAESEHLDGVDSARMLALTNLAGADGSIGCWNDKYHWRFWRPITAIREAASDGNPATKADPDWLPLFNPTISVSGAPLVTPGFPDHPSGHTCISGAFVHALQGFFGTDKVAVHGDQQQVLSRALSAAELRPLLGGAQGDHRRPRLERDPLPDRGCAGRRPREEGRALRVGSTTSSRWAELRSGGAWPSPAPPAGRRGDVPGKHRDRARGRRRMEPR